MIALLNSPALATVMTGIILVGGVVFAIAQWGNGRSQGKSGIESDAAMTIRLIKEARDALEAKLKDQNLTIIQQGKDIAALQAELKSKDELIERYVELLQNRNPELESLMKQVITALSDQTKAISALLAKPTTVTVNNSPPPPPTP